MKTFHFSGHPKQSHGSPLSVDLELCRFEKLPIFFQFLFLRQLRYLVRFAESFAVLHLAEAALPKWFVLVPFSGVSRRQALFGATRVSRRDLLCFLLLCRRADQERHHNDSFSPQSVTVRAPKKQKEKFFRFSRF